MITEILREKEVQRITKRSRVQRWRDIKDGTFPQPVRLGKNAIGWYADEIEKWLKSRKRVTYEEARPRGRRAAPLTDDKQP